MRPLAAAVVVAALLAPIRASTQIEEVIVTKVGSIDEASWHIFVTMVAPAKGAGHNVEYETWASDDDVYGATPHWPAPRDGKRLTRSLGGGASHPRAVLPQMAAPSQCAKPADGAAGNFPATACIGEEVRHDRDTYDYLTQNGLNTTKGLIAAYASHKIVALPFGATIAKADWVPVTDIIKWQPAYKDAAAVRRAFYTNSANLNGKTEEFALVGISVQSKTTPDWLWFTVEHRSNPGRCDVIGCHDAFGARAANVAPAAAPNSDYGACEKSPALFALFKSAHLAPVWNNYCLKGTQTKYVTAQGAPTKLGNSVIERMNHGIPIPQISCITCHSYAAFDKNGAPATAIMQHPPLGRVDEKLLDGLARDDSVWGILSAK